MLFFKAIDFKITVPNIYEYILFYIFTIRSQNRKCQLKLKKRKYVTKKLFERIWKLAYTNTSRYAKHPKKVSDHYNGVAIEFIFKPSWNFENNLDVGNCFFVVWCELLLIYKFTCNNKKPKLEITLNISAK